MGNLAMPLSTTRFPDPANGTKPMGRILVVEDDPAVQKALKRLFETEGFTVEVQSNGQSALESFQSAAPLAIILDLRLPRLSGRDLCKEIKAQAPSLPIVVLSAASDVSDKVLLLELGADDYVTKPFSPRELLARVRAALRHTDDRPGQGRAGGGRRRPLAGGAGAAGRRRGPLRAPRPAGPPGRNGIPPSWKSGTDPCSISFRKSPLTAACACGSGVPGFSRPIIVSHQLLTSLERFCKRQISLIRCASDSGSQTS